MTRRNLRLLTQLTPTLFTSAPDLKLGLALHDLPLFLVQPDDLGVLRAPVDLLEERRDGAVLALRLALDLRHGMSSQGFLVKKQE